MKPSVSSWHNQFAMKRSSLFFFLFFSCLVSCSEEESTIPSLPVSLILDLRNEDKELRNTPSYKTYTTQTVNHRLLGYAGVLVIHAHEDNYYAFDLSCPYEAKTNVKVEVDENHIYAVCPQCGTKYDISAGVGSPNGVGRSYLRRYLVTITSGGDILNVTN